MQHIRVATYKMTRGTPEEVAALAASGMLETFREHAGFIGYSLAKTDDAHIMSISVWKSHRDAEGRGARRRLGVGEHRGPHLAGVERRGRRLVQRQRARRVIDAASKPV